MQEYKRQIAYLYAYERGEQLRSTGFVKQKNGADTAGWHCIFADIAIRVKPPEMFIFIFIIRTEP